jgi:hypothetical protein
MKYNAKSLINVINIKHKCKNDEEEAIEKLVNMSRSNFNE